MVYRFAINFPHMLPMLSDYRDPNRPDQPVTANCHEVDQPQRIWWFLKSWEYPQIIY